MLERSNHKRQLQPLNRQPTNPVGQISESENLDEDKHFVASAAGSKSNDKIAANLAEFSGY